LNPIADFIVDSEQLDANLEGTEIVEAFFINTSQNFSNPNDPLADTTFYWNLNYDLVDWYLTHDFFEIMDTIYHGERIYEVCLVAQNKNGCTDTACKTIIVHAMPDLLPPNIFTPDGDGINDMFTFEFKSTAIVSFNCLIINRWGNKMTELMSIADGWNGKDAGGKECPDGVYFYTYQATSTNGTVFSGQGTVQLVREH
jgi:gliding motility-associated-like protein